MSLVQLNLAVPIRLLSLALVGLAGLLTGARVPAAEDPPELRQVEQVRRLSAAEAEKQLPVRLRGVVTFHNENLFSRFLQDDTAGIYLREGTPELNPGDLVEVIGSTRAGEYAPVVKPHEVRIIGRQPLPPARPATFEQLASGREDSQLVEVTGIVRSVRFDEPSEHHAIVLATGGGRLTLYAKDIPVSNPADLVDASIRVRGVCSSQFNRQRQLFAIRLMVPGREDLQVLEEAPVDPFAVPSRTIGSLLQFAPHGTFGHRVKLQGTVVLHQPGGLLFIEDDTYGLQVQTRQGTELQVGDRVEVLGFPRQGPYTPILEDAIYRRIGSGALPKARAVTVDEALTGVYDCRLVQLRATVLDRGTHSREQFLVLESAKFIFQAHLPPADKASSLRDLRNGSQISVTGVCLIDPGEWQAGEQWRARTFQILLRSPADIQVIKAPPWWTLRRLLWAVGLLLLVILIGMGWVLVLRKKVRDQTQIIRRQMLVDAALKERYQDLFENANDMVFTHEISGRLTSINRAGELLLQRDRDQLLGRDILSLVAEDQQPAARQWLRQVVEGQETAPAEWDFLNASGQRVKLEISSRLVEQSGKPPEIEGVARDVTERRRLERELLEVSTREQQRIGHDLHDGVCQQLAGITYMVDSLGDRLQEEARPEAMEAEKIRSLLSEATVQARTVARGLFPVRLEENGLIAALEELADGACSRFRIACEFDLAQPEPSEVDNETALHVYYIAHEALTNAVKHGKPSRIDLVLKPLQDRFQLIVRDNGQGFESARPHHSGMGIRIMQHRARVIGATLEIWSRPGQGTEVACIFFERARKT